MIPPVSGSHQSDDCILVDADEYRNSNDHNTPPPVFAQFTEDMLEEIHLMDAEVEMDDTDEGDEPMVDIDTCYKNNPLDVTDYISDLYTYYKQTESLSCVPENYMAQQSDINEKMRAILIDWLILVHHKFELVDETLYLTVHLIDRFMAVESVEREKLQLVGVTALLLASKYEEVLHPTVHDLEMITGGGYSREEVLDMEKKMIIVLQFDLWLPTPYMFMRQFLKAAQSNRRMDLLVFYIMELCLVEYEMLRFAPSLFAAAAVFTAQCTLSGCKQWRRMNEKHTGYTQDELLECSRLMVGFHQKARSGKLTSVYEKYSTSKQGYAAKIEPAVFLINER